MVSFSIALTIFRVAKEVDCKKVSLFDFWDKKDGNADKGKSKNRNITLLELDIDHDWGIYA